MLILFGFISQAQAQCSGSNECFDFKLVSATAVNATTTRLTFSVKTNCDKDLSNVAFELPVGMKAANPKGTKYNYTVENPTNNPFYSVKFEGKGISGYKNGVEDVFSYEVNTAAYNLMPSLRIQAKAGQNVGAVTFNPKNCGSSNNGGGNNNGGNNGGNTGGNNGGGNCSDSQPRPIMGDQHPCPGDVITYCIENDRNYTSFEWDVPRAHAGEPPVGWVILSGQGTKCVTVRVGQKSGTMKVKVNDPVCGIKVATLPVKPGKSFEVIISGPVSICVKQPQTYTASIKKAQGNGNIKNNEFIYNWTVPADWKIQSGQGTDKIVVIPGSTDGEVNLYVSDNAKVSGNGNNGNGVGGYKKGYCGTASDGIYVETKENCGVTPTCPTIKVDITGKSQFCKGDVLTFDAVVDGVANAKTNGGVGTSTWSKQNKKNSEVEYAYNWTVPTGWEVVSGQGTSQLVVRAGTNAGNVAVSVAAKKKKDPSYCGNGSDNHPVTVSPVCGSCPKPELEVDGPSEVCHATDDRYTFRVKNPKLGVKYHFYLPEEFTVVESGNGFVTIDVNSANNDTTLYVTVVAINANNCGAEAVCLKVDVKDCGTTPPCVMPKVALVAPDTICNLADEPTTIRVAEMQEGVTYTFTVPEGFIVLDEGAGYVTVVAVFEEAQLGQAQTISVTATNECGTQTANASIVVADCGLGNPLPVALTRFEGSSRSGAVVLAWSTASEKNNDRFEIERSINGKDFKKVGEVKGNGNSTATVDYSYTDRSAASGTVYYRLRQVDFDNAFEYSKVIAVSHAATASSNAAVSVYPNPVTDGRVSIRFQDQVKGSATVRLVDLSGRVLHAQEVASVEGEIALNLTNLNLKAGIYLISVNANGQNTTQRVMVR
ncbi:T9SS type A sorting domain-containing protein [Rufibacter aurantiacus]|uniref:T9SS type A sorting domain-containing protein n=1 Tax=Rufibacter aurantiacus TaxID=2817374 RepID=UPI001B318937|nr:T9SS type A sorting domain-containing protein [Rufibacter aurantiacus]